VFARMKSRSLMQRAQLDLFSVVIETSGCWPNVALDN
jgi:hypothetical protein